jgi:aryl-alcohol dehydrogenase-like predicted oxidoreductase
MQKAFDLGIALFDAADTYGNGLSEELIAKDFPKRRDDFDRVAEIWRDCWRSI